MNLRLTFFLLVVLSLRLSAQSDDVPSLVQDKFKTEFPGAKDIEWSTDENNYVVEFNVGITMYTCVYDESGNQLEKAELINDEAVPATLLDYIKKNYPEAYSSYTEKVTNDKNEVFYRSTVENEDNTMVLISDLSGKITQEKAK